MLGGERVKKFAIMDGDMFLQRLEPNDRYANSVRGIQTNLHTYSEYTPIFGHEERWFDSRTATSYLTGLVEHLRWEGDRYHAYALIFREEGGQHGQAENLRGAGG